jgi:hypothetical protein
VVSGTFAAGSILEFDDHGVAAVEAVSLVRGAAPSQSRFRAK